MTTGPLELFYAYAREDEALRDQLNQHLKILKRQGFIREWHDREISAGKEWAQQIDEHLKSADIILLLISSAFLASDYCYDVEMKEALRRHEAGEARVIPIILRMCDWKPAPFGKLQALPKDAQPVMKWEDRDEAFTDIALEIRRVIAEVNGAGYDVAEHEPPDINRRAVVKQIRRGDIPSEWRVYYASRSRSLWYALQSGWEGFWVTAGLFGLLAWWFIPPLHQPLTNPASTLSALGVISILGICGAWITGGVAWGNRNLFLALLPTGIVYGEVTVGKEDSVKRADYKNVSHITVQAKKVSITLHSSPVLYAKYQQKHPTIDLDLAVFEAPVSLAETIDHAYQEFKKHNP